MGLCMRIFRPLLSFLFLSLVLAGFAGAHPMGNLSINHYARLEPDAKGVNVTYVLDLAEIPTFELTQTWNTPQGTPMGVVESKAAAQAREWVRNLVFTEDGKPRTATVGSTRLAIIDGAGNLPVFRITTKLSVLAQGGRFEYEDRNYATRAGWREVVVVAGAGGKLENSSVGSQDLSEGLTAYPQDPTKAPPQDTKASFTWKLVALPPVMISSLTQPDAPAVVKAPDAVPDTVRDVRPAEAQSGGTIKRNDAISTILRMKTISWPLMATLIALSFWFGALHALEPGHGKTMVAAYLVGEKGTAKHAVLLGGMVTFTHTISVFILGLVTMFLSQYIMPDKLSKILGVISGLSIVWIGGMMLWRRTAVALHKRHHSHHDHGHHHSHDHAHDHDHDHDHNHDHAHDPFTHTHDGHTHSHAPTGDISIGSLIALGASGGLVPCPSALILLLSAISIGRVGLGLILLFSFSIGLAIVLSCTGLLVLYAKNLLPEKSRGDNFVFRYLPVASAAVIFVIGVVMTSVSLGWIPATRFIS